MDPTTDPTAAPPNEPAPAELTEPTRPRSRRNQIVAGTLVVALLAAGVGVLASTGTDDSDPPPLALIAGSDGSANTAEDDSAAGAPLGADIARSSMIAPWGSYVFHHDGTWPATASSAPVYRLVAADLDEARLRAMAEAAGLGEVEVRTIDGGGMEAVGADHTLSVYPFGGAWTISMYPTYAAIDDVEPGTSGGGASGSDGAVSPPNDGTVDDTTEGTEKESPDTTDSQDTVARSEPDVYTPPPAPEDLPSAEEAEAIARDLLDALGVLDGGEWTYTVNDASSYGVACAEPAGDDGTPSAGTCEEFEDPIVYERGVMVSRTLDGRPVSGLDWWVSVGDGGEIMSLSGTWADLEPVDDYPLRSVDDVYQDLVDGKGFYGGAIPMLASDTGVVADGDTAVSSDDSTAGGDVTSDDTVASGSSGSDPSMGAPEPMTIAPCLIDPATLGAPEEDGKDIAAADGTDVAADDPGTPIDCPEPEPIDIDVTGVAVAYQMVPAWEDGAEVGYVVPTYRFTGTFRNGDGEWTNELVAIESEFLTPPAIDPGLEPEPVPEPTPATEPATEPAPLPVEPGDGDDPSVDGEGAEIQARAEDLAKAVVGLSLADAEAQAAPLGITVRVAEEDGEAFALTMDYRIDRINVVITDGTITAATVG